MMQRIVFYFLLSFLLATACVNSNTNYIPLYSHTIPIQANEYVFGVHPLYNPKALQEIYGPLTDYLTSNIPDAVFRLEASRNYSAYDEKLYARKFHFALPNPYQTVNALSFGYKVFGKQGDDHKFCGIILVRKDAGIDSIPDLKNKAVSFPAPTALAATMMPQYYIHTNGLDVMKDIDIKYVGSQESSIMNVYNKNTSAGATWPVPWIAFSKKHPDIAEQLELKWETKPLVNNSLMVRDDVSDTLLRQVSELLYNLHTTTKGKEILAAMEVSKIEEANNETYRKVHDFLHNFNHEVRSIIIKDQVHE